MDSQRLNQCFKDNCDPDDLKIRLAYMLGSIYPEYLPAFKSYRDSILGTLEDQSQV